MSLLVTDTGIGMSEAQSEKLFEPFQQGDNTTTRKFGGTGLGLALSRKLGRALGGNVTLVGCEADKGCTFKLELIAFPSAVVATASPEETLDNSKTTKRLEGFKFLVADDSPDNRLLIQLLLKREGALVALACDGEEAVRMALSESYDAVLMDIQMPILDGYEALNQLRKENYRKPVLALTAHAMKEERDRAIAAGFSDHVPKPVNPGTLIDSVLTHVRRGQ